MPGYGFIPREATGPWLLQDEVSDWPITPKALKESRMDK